MFIQRCIDLEKGDEKCIEKKGLKLKCTGLFNFSYEQNLKSKTHTQNCETVIINFIWFME